jgi:hypothetical protein
VTSPGESIDWNAQRARFDWSVTRGGRTTRGHARTYAEAFSAVTGQRDWRVWGDQVRYVGPRSPRGGIPRDPR